MFIRKLAFVTATATVLLGAGATAAFAGNTPSPSPTYTNTPTPPPPPPMPRAALWQFDFTGANIDGLQLNDVRGVGAIPMSRWQERDLSPNVSQFFRGANSVTLRHNRLPLPVFNLNTCTATFDQLGNFRIINGTGTGAGLRVVPGTDEYLLRGVVSVDLVQRHTRHHSRHHNNAICPLQFINPGQLRVDIENNLPISGRLATLVDFDVQGNAQLVRVSPLPTPTPTPTGPGHFFVPSVNSNPDNSQSA